MSCAILYSEFIVQYFASRQALDLGPGRTERGSLMPIERRPLREQIREELLRRLDRGDFTAGTDVNEATLAVELGVSRTPLREALITLAGEGVLESNQGRGFSFAPVSRKEFRELCEIVAALEALALDSS